jgi:phosphoglycolate phosphatase
MHQALSETGVAANAALMIGDTTFDIQMACNAGARAVGVSWGVHEPDELLSAGAESVVCDVSAICPTVTKLFGETNLG